MLLADNREGEHSLAWELRARGLDLDVMSLDAGDYVVLGADRAIGVERKRIGDLVRVIADGRFVSEQLPKLAASYDHIYLLVEGAIRRGPDGELLWLQGREYKPVHYARPNGWAFSSVARWLMSVESAGVSVVKSYSARDSVDWLVELHEWAQQEEHGTLARVYERPLATLGTPSQTRRWAKIQPGVGDKLSALVADHFGSQFAGVNAGVEEWVKIPGIGLKKALEIYNSMRAK